MIRLGYECAEVKYFERLPVHSGILLRLGLTAALFDLQLFADTSFALDDECPMVSAA